MRLRHIRSIALLLAGQALLLWPVARAEPLVPGFAVTTYATVAGQNRFAFDAAGTLYIGNTDNSAGGASLHSVGPGGGPVGSFGPAIFDPDAVLFDATGAVSGVAGALLVGGNAITAIRPDGTAFTLLAGNGATPFFNVGDMAVDRSGRLLFTDSGNGNPGQQAVFAFSGGSLTRLFTEVGGMSPDSITVDAANHIYTSRDDGGVSVHAADGSLLDANFIAGLGASPVIEFAHGGAFGDGLYALDSFSGVLRRIDAAGHATVIGTGFGSNSNEFAFGPDGALYVGEFDNARVLRIAAVPESGTWLLMLGGLAALGVRRSTTAAA